MISVELYTRPGCHLCDDAKAHLDALQSVTPHRLVTIDIDSDLQLQKEYGLIIPVIKAGPFTLKAPFSRQDLQGMLAAAFDRERNLKPVDNSTGLNEARREANWTRSDAFNRALSHHYMALFNLLVAAYLGFAFLAPLLASAGLSLPAGLLYRGYSLVCHQLGYRSFFIMGEQPFYPRAAAGMQGLETYEIATGQSEAGDVKAVLTARKYIGDEHVGYKVALCERDIAIYGGILLFGLLFSITGRKIKAIPWFMWLALAIAPIALDGFSQLLSQPPLGFFPYRESTPFLRVLTGFLFGFMTAWFGYPLVEESMADSRSLTDAKWKRLHSPSHQDER